MSIISSATITETMAPAIKGRRIDMPSGITGKEFWGTGDQKGDDNFEALLYPNRSLPNNGFIAVMGIVIIVNLALGVGFTLAGAWPILIFGGLDIFFVWLAFKVSYRQGRLHERIRISADEMLVSRVLPSGHELQWYLPPYWTRITYDSPVRHESQIGLHYKGETLIVGSFLSPKERGALGERLKEALQMAIKSG